jgi:hypothetical protein
MDNWSFNWPALLINGFTVHGVKQANAFLWNLFPRRWASNRFSIFGEKENRLLSQNEHKQYSSAIILSHKPLLAAF